MAHPALRSAIVADLKRLDLHFRDYTRSANPQRLGLLDATTAIGTRDGWQAVLAEHGVSVRRHSIVRDAPDARPYGIR